MKWKVGGQLVFTFNVGNGLQRIAGQRSFNDGRYHYVQFTRTGSTATVRVDDSPAEHTHTSSSG